MATTTRPARPLLLDALDIDRELLRQQAHRATLACHADVVSSRQALRLLRLAQAHAGREAEASATTLAIGSMDTLDGALRAVLMALEVRGRQSR